MWTLERTFGQKSTEVWTGWFHLETPAEVPQTCSHAIQPLPLPGALPTAPRPAGRRAGATHSAAAPWHRSCTQPRGGIADWRQKAGVLNFPRRPAHAADGVRTEAWYKSSSTMQPLLCTNHTQRQRHVSCAAKATADQLPATLKRIVGAFQLVPDPMARWVSAASNVLLSVEGFAVLPHRLAAFNC